MSKQLIYRYFTILMAALVLTGSVGVGLVENYCMMRGKTVSLVFKEEKKGCNLCRAPKKESSASLPQDAPVFKKMHCCVEKQQLKSIDFQAATTAKQLEKNGKGPTEPFLPSGFDTSFLQRGGLTIQTIFPAAVVSFSSPYFGRSMLSFVQRFLI